MEPTLKLGALVVVDTLDKLHKLRVIIAYSLNEHVYFGRIEPLKNNTKLILHDNPDLTSQIVNTKNAADFKLIGKVILCCQTPL